MHLEILRKIGLSEGELRVYNALLELGIAPVNKIHEKTGIERRNIYDILNKLIERGLISYVIENKKKYFQIAHPGRIIGYIEEKKGELEETKEEIEKEIPLLLKKFEQRKPEVKAEVFRGIEGIKSVFEDILNYNECYFIGGGAYVAIKTPHFWKSYDEHRVSAA